jgi:hypothetical protein
LVIVIVTHSRMTTGALVVIVTQFRMTTGALVIVIVLLCCVSLKNIEIYSN